MKRTTRGLGLVAVLGALALGVAACGGGGAGNGGPGGTLKVVGSSDVDHLDTASGYTLVSVLLTRQYARTLFNVKGADRFADATRIQADVATELPTTGNGGISADARTYTIKLRTGVRWNTPAPREVTAADFVRGIKRLCNPAQPSGGIGYYTATIEGMDAFCAGFRKVGATDAAAVAAYQNGHQIAGLRAKDDKTLVVRLKRPAGDFTNIMGLQFSAAAPAEYDRYLPDSPDYRRHTISDGPYQITAYTPNKSYQLARNPSWRQDTDPLRAQNPGRIQITMGQDSPDVVQQQMELGTADLSWDQPVPTSRIPGLRSNPNFKIQDGSTNNPYLDFNTLSPNNGRALAKPAVRQAIEYAIDKAALVQIYGGPRVSTVLNQVIPPGSVGHEEFNLYATPGNSGDPAKCRRLLAAAGHPNGLTLQFPYRTNSNHPKVAQSVQANLRACGITANLTPDTNGNFYGKTLVNPADAEQGKWDIAAPGWIPDWYGNNGRTNIVPLFDGRTYGPNSTDYGGYNNPAVNALIDQALQAKNLGEAAKIWANADRLIMQDAAIVPFQNQRYPIFHSSRVKNALYLPTSQAFDLNQVKLS
ncbi:MAG: peptide/nickel transport system substrate-binding protein [Streptosporangiaceae bacterium]|jgi:peptide/nickel transport system substrate-binding protein|nr:oligopeptide transporter periplasmic oligopeptide-binding protein OppA [Streptosporangiaceae bacterium]MDX6434617.1 peptide/nickel transport system substrate-binding protein [Streptosporangiaceae bacterium]